MNEQRGATFRWERPDAGDFPFYKKSGGLPWWGWLLILVGVGLGFALDLGANAVPRALFPDS